MGCIGGVGMHKAALGVVFFFPSHEFSLHGFYSGVSRSRHSIQGQEFSLSCRFGDDESQILTFHFSKLLIVPCSLSLLFENPILAA